MCVLVEVLMCILLCIIILQALLKGQALCCKALVCSVIWLIGHAISSHTFDPF